jgi:TPR repeat protein
VRERDILSSTGEEYYPPYGGPTAYVKGYSYAVRPVMKTKVTSKSLLYAYGSAPFPRNGYGHEEATAGLTGDANNAKGSTGSTGTSGSTSGHPVAGRDRVLQRPPGVPAAILWLQQSADMGNAEALFLLAYRYEHGLGVVKDRAVTDQLFKW